MSDRFVSSAFKNGDIDNAMGRMLGQEGLSVTPKCEGCNRDIVDKFGTVPSGKKYHIQCMPDSGFCARCNKPIVGKLVNAIGKTWHDGCWTCGVCKSALLQNAFVEISGYPYCIKCEQKVRKPTTDVKGSGDSLISQNKTVQNRKEEEKSQIKNELFQNVQGGKETCKWCRKIIATYAVPFKGALYHRECFCCSVCANPVSDDGYVERDDLIYCKSCVGSSGVSATNPCEACGQQLVGVYVTAGGKHYHSKCFLCGECGGSLSGGYALKAGKPLCSDCGTKPPQRSTSLHVNTRKAGITVDPRTGKVTKQL